MRIAITLVLTAAALTAPIDAVSQAYPVKPIRMVIPFGPGGSVDLIGRMIAPRLAEDLGQPVVVDNRAGANGIIGTELAARSLADGYTLLYTTSSTLVTAPFLVRKLPFDVFKDFTHIAIVYQSFQALSVNTAFPARNAAELVEMARRNPSKLTYATSGIGSAFHLWGELFDQIAGVKTVHVPYKLAATSYQDIMSGRVDISYYSYNLVLPFAEAGKMRILAIMDSKRYVNAPDIPAIAETLPNFQRMPSWISVSGPAGLPRPIVNRLNASVIKAINAPELRAEFTKGGAQAVGGTPEEFVAAMKADIEVTARVVKVAKIEPE